MATVLTVDHGDILAKKDFYGNVTAPAEYAVPYGDTQDVLYIHQKTNSSLTGIDSFFVGVGDTESEALKDLLMQGATNCLPLNLNKGAATKASVFIGYHYYNPDYIDHDHLAIVIADVSGKGIPAAMFMVMAKGIIETQCMGGKSPADILENVNKIICAKNHEKMFVTVWLGILDLRTGELTASNAGHEYPVLKNPDSDFEVITDKHGFVIGGFKRMKYEDYKINMKPGSKLFVYTDGVTEATDANNQLFGIERTVLSLNKSKNASLQTLLETVDADVREFVGDAEQFDDLTMMCIEYYGNSAVKDSH